MAKPAARMDSTDRAISRILDQQVGAGEESKQKENDQKIMNINFRMDHNNRYGTANTSASQDG